MGAQRRSRPGESKKAFLAEERVKLTPEGLALPWGGVDWGGSEGDRSTKTE